MHSIQDVIKNCTEYIDVLRQSEVGCFLTRDFSDYNIDIKYFESLLTEREPLNMHPDMHLALNNHFEKIFDWRVRNGLFSFGVKENYNELPPLGYGKSYLLFPCGQFRYVYDPNIFDLFGTYMEFCKNNEDQNPDVFIKTIKYTDKNLNSAMSEVLENGRSAEIMIGCDSYYLVNMKYAEELINLIWN